MLTEITIQLAVENEGANHHLYGSLRVYQPTAERAATALQPEHYRAEHSRIRFRSEMLEAAQISGSS
jgi:hypothetical protein